MTSPVVWNPFTNDFDYVRSGNIIPTVNKIITDYSFDGLTYSLIGNVIPVGDQINFVGSFSSVDNPVGIQTVAVPDESNLCKIELTNRLSASGVVNSSSTKTVLTFDLGGDVSAYRFDFSAICIDTVTGDSIGLTTFANVKTNGTTATVVDTPLQDVDDDLSLSGCNLAFMPVGSAITITIQNGIANDLKYNVVGTYIKVDA